MNTNGHCLGICRALRSRYGKYGNGTFEESFYSEDIGNIRDEEGERLTMMGTQNQMRQRSAVLNDARKTFVTLRIRRKRFTTNIT